VTARPPPWTLNEPIVKITRPGPAVVNITRRTPAAITVAWPPVRVTQDQPPPPPGVIRLAAPPQHPARQPLPPVLRDMLSNPLPSRRR
jgi:hypothetical protein